MFRSSNPALNQNVLSKARSHGFGVPMTLQGTVNKCFILVFLMLMTATWIWSQMMKTVGPFESQASVTQSIQSMMPFVIGGAIAGFILVLVTAFNLSISRFTAPAYALCEGFVLGGISAIFEYQYPGIAIQAVGLTLATLFCMLAAYQSGMIKVTDKLRMGLMSALGAIFVIYLLSWILGFFQIQIPLIHGSGPVGILFSLVVTGVAALFLVMDFDMISRLSQQGSPKYMEWYCAMSLLITLVWLYMEMLRLLSKLRDRR